MQVAVLTKDTAESFATSLWLQEDEKLCWDGDDGQIISARIEKRLMRLDVQSYNNAFFRNSFKLSNPNRSGAGVYALIARSESDSFLLDEESNISVQLDSFKRAFVNMLISKANDDYDEDAYTFLSNLLNNYPDEKGSILLWVQSVFNEHCENQDIVIGLLKLFLEFDFDELDPMAPTIAACCKNHKSYAVKTVTFSLLGHWCNKQALAIIEAFAEPQEMMLRIKYKKLKYIIATKCII